MRLEKISKVVEESTILKDEIQQRIIKQEEEKKLSEIKQNIMTESIYVKKAEQIQFLITHIQEALGQQISAKLLFRASRDGNTIPKFHEFCDNKGPLLFLLLTSKDILCGGFSSIDWKSSGEWVVDKKCFVFSLKLMKIYKRQNDTYNLYFNNSYGPCYGNGGVSINSSNKIYSVINGDPFKVPANSSGLHEITEKSDGSFTDFKDYEVFSI
jgi:hypothetical protein